MENLQEVRNSIDPELYTVFNNTDEGRLEALNWIREEYTLGELLGELDYDRILREIGEDLMINYISYNSDVFIFDSEEEIIKEFKDTILEEYGDVLPDGNFGRSLYRNECIDLIERLAEKEGWDFIYEKLEQYKV